MGLIQPAVEAFDSAQTPRDGGGIKVLPPLMRQPSAHILGGHIAQRRLARRSAPVAAQKSQEPRDVAALPFDGVRACVAHAGERTQPFLKKRQRAVAAHLGQSFDGATPFQAVGTDEPVVTALMSELLRDAGSYDPYLSVLPERFVQRVWAETKFLADDARDVDELVRMLGGPAAAERLKDRVDLEFARTNPTFFAADDVVSLDVDVKNVDTLLVKVFEIDAVAYFDAFSAPVDASLDLDGLVANDERTLTFELNGRARECVILDKSIKTDTKKRTKADPADKMQVGAPIPAMVSAVYVSEGQKIKKKEKLCVLEAMKMQTTVYALADGVVDVIEVQAGDQVDSKDLLVRLR